MKTFPLSCVEPGTLWHSPAQMLPENNQNQMLMGSFIGTAGAHLRAGPASQTLKPSLGPSPNQGGSSLISNLELRLFSPPGYES